MVSPEQWEAGVQGSAMARAMFGPWVVKALTDFVRFFGSFCFRAVAKLKTHRRTEKGDGLYNLNHLGALTEACASPGAPERSA